MPNEKLGQYPSLRDMAEDTKGDLPAAIAAWWDMAVMGCIADVLLLRAAEQLGILPPGVNAGEHITKWKV